ncbi:MAG TPA: class I SAM-dependent methyltransferase [Polyangiaceae bacterium]|nr:class I SAM-dependent methyltransferase [Polyangiaceae bacterium]
MIETNWGAEAVDPKERSLPGLKVSFLLRHAPRTGRVLEIGSGDGKLLRTLAEHSSALDLVGCDVRPPRTPADGYAFELIDGTLPRHMDGAFDTVLLFDVLEHVPDPAATLGDAARVLRPGGKLIAFVPVEGELVSAYTFFRAVLGKNVYVETKEHVQAFTHARLRALVEARFTVDDWAYAYHALGQTMDAGFFGAQKLGKLREMWWNDNTFYNAQKKHAGGAAGVMNRLLRVGNLMAWAESRMLADVKTASAGALFAATVRA